MGFFGGGGAGITYGDFVGATTSTAGTAGLVPAPAAGKNTRALFSDASFGEVPLLPQFKTANTNRICSWLADSGASFAPAIKVRYFSLIYIPADGSIDTLLAATGTGPSPAFNINIAFWDCGEDGRPSTYLSGVNITSGTSGFTTISGAISSLAVKRGFYWMSTTSDATGSTNSQRGLLNRFFAKNFLGAAGGLDGSAASLQYTCSGNYDQTTHETFTQVNSGNSPLTGVEYV
jgi:hypothetical protein